MRIKDATRRRLAALTGLCFTLALAAATNAAAYPAMPEGEPVERADTLSTPSSTMVETSSGGIDWIAVVAVIAGVGLAALAVIAVALIFTGRRRRPLAVH